MGRGLGAAIGVATGGTGTGLGIKLKVTERLDMGQVAGIDKGWTVGRQTRQDFRIHREEVRLSFDDVEDNEEDFSKVEIEELDRSFFTLPPPENPHHYWYLNCHHHYYHHHQYHHHY